MSAAEMTVAKSSKAKIDNMVPLTAKEQRADPIMCFMEIGFWFLRIKSPGFMIHAFCNTVNRYPQREMLQNI